MTRSEELLKDETVVLVLTNNKKVDKTIPNTVPLMIEKSCKDIGMLCYIITPDTNFVTVNNGTVTIYDASEKIKPIKVEASNTVCFVRSGMTTDPSGIVYILQNGGVFLVNYPQSIIFCSNKLTSHLSFKDNGIPTPKTSFVNNSKVIRESVKRVGGKYPIIIKSLKGSQGIGVSIADTYQSLVSNMQALWKHKAKLLIQQYIPVKYDIRTIVLDGKIVACVKRVAVEGEFRTNISRGGNSERYELSNDEIDLVHKVAEISGGYLVGVDHINHKGKLYALEVNGSPNMSSPYHRPYIKYTSYVDEKPDKLINGQKLCDVIIDYISDKNNWGKHE